MDRRGFLAILALLAGPRVAGAQQPARPVRIGVLCSGVCPFGGPVGSYRSLTEALARVGLVQGRTLAWDVGGVTNTEDQVVVEAPKLAARRPDLILVWPGNVTAARAAKVATSTIPIVLMAVPDAVQNGLVGSLGRPGGNVSGTSVPTRDLTIKQVQILKEISPRLKAIVVVQGDLDRGDRETVEHLRGAAASLQLDGGISSTDASHLEQALAAAPAGSSGILIVGNMPILAFRRIRVLALERKLPLLIPWRAWEGAGGDSLITYGPRFSDVAARTAALIDRIVKGARPGEIPVEEPTSYELVIDGIMAKALGLTIPPSVRARADEVIE